MVNCQHDMYHTPRDIHKVSTMFVRLVLHLLMLISQEVVLVRYQHLLENLIVEKFHDVFDVPWGKIKKIVEKNSIY